jgi:hypothetical protein
MPEVIEKIDKAKAVGDRFRNSFKSLSTPDDYRDFVLRYYCSQEEKENMLNIIGLAELSGRNIVEWEAFQKLFKIKSYIEFSRTKDRKFISEEANLGFMM